MKWEMKLKKVDDLIARSNASLFDRVKLLVDVYNDPEFMAHHKGDIDAAEYMLDSKLGDYAMSFMQARCLFNRFPQRAHWIGNPIRKMLAEAMDADRSERKEREVPSTRKGPVPRKDHDEVVKQREAAVNRVDSLQDETSRLRDEIAKLREENAVLRGKVEELERLLDKQFA